MFSSITVGLLATEYVSCLIQYYDIKKSGLAFNIIDILL